MSLRGDVPGADIDAFARFAAQLSVEDGSAFVLQGWQREVVEDVLSHRESLVLLPKANGKTALAAVVGLFHLLTTPDARCYVAAASRDQATLLFDHAAGFITRSESLQQRLVPREGYREIRCRRDRGRMKVLASDADTSDGTGATLALVDELHRHRSPDLYAALRDGLGKRKGQLCTISTAGWDVDSPLGVLRTAALSLPDQDREGAHLRAASEGFVMHQWAVPEDADTNDLDAVKQANPSEFVTVEDLRARKDSPSMREADWLRFACNQWVAAERSWLPDGAWEACADPDVEMDTAGRMFVGVDIGRKRDTSAVVVCQRQEGRVVVGAKVFEPGGDGQDLAVVEQELRDLAADFNVVEVAFDPWSFTRSAELLADEGLNMVEFPQSNTRMVPASTRLFEAIRDGRIVHDGDPILAAHVRAGVTTETERGWRLTKRKSRDANDALIALVMALERAESEPERTPKVIDLRQYLPA